MAEETTQGNGDSSAIEDPLFLQNSDSPGMKLVASVLTANNFLTWIQSMQIALGAKNKMAIVDGRLTRPSGDTAMLEKWKRVDYMVRSWILNSISTEIAESFLYAGSAMELWNEIRERYGESNGPMIYQLQREIDETNEEIEPIDSWEDEEDDAEPEIGDGGDGGGVNLQNCPWGERSLSLAREVILQFGEGIELFAFKTSPRGYIYVRLDKLANEYGCPSMDEIVSYNREYKKKIDEVGALGEIPNDLAIEVSSPGAERLLKVPEDLDRFKEYPMRVSYVEEVGPEKNGVFFLDSVETESGICVWRLADVNENRDPAAKGRPLSRKKKDWRLKLPYSNSRKVTLFLDY